MAENRAFDGAVSKGVYLGQHGVRSSSEHARIPAYRLQTNALFARAARWLGAINRHFCRFATTISLSGVLLGACPCCGMQVSGYCPMHLLGDIADHSADPLSQEQAS